MSDGKNFEERKRNKPRGEEGSFVGTLFWKLEIKAFD